ncbi:MAG TPA: hypothetical protein VGR76_17965 [Candidatus Angelobacter sp.]|jgi:hypothetical protein|nr:hypothetical protein [Candidatus Angelobacter sp.]
MTKPKQIPARPDLEALRKREPYLGKQLCIIDPATQQPVIERVQFPLDLLRLQQAYGSEAVSKAETISQGEIAIPVEIWKGLFAWIDHLESHIDKKYLAPPPLTTQERRMAKIDAQAWAASPGLRKDRRSKKGIYQPWGAVQKFFPKNFNIEERTLNRLRDRENYHAAFIKECSAAWLSKRSQK